MELVVDKSECRLLDGGGLFTRHVRVCFANKDSRVILENQEAVNRACGRYRFPPLPLPFSCSPGIKLSPTAGNLGSLTQNVLDTHPFLGTVTQTAGLKLMAA